jgi:hypothetical protein
MHAAQWAEGKKLKHAARCTERLKLMHAPHEGDKQTNACCPMG